LLYGRLEDEKPFNTVRRFVQQEDYARCGLTIPSQLRRMLRARGRDLHAEFLRLLPERPRPIAIQRFSPRRIGLILGVLAGAFVAINLVMSNLNGLGLTPS
jgi:hypothetical protein